jgi:hypothetical protein
MSLFRLDASMVSNDHNYFVFEDLLHDVMRPHAAHLLLLTQPYRRVSYCLPLCSAPIDALQVMLVFSRDEWVEQNAAANSQKQFSLSTQVISSTSTATTAASTAGTATPITTMIFCSRCSWARKLGEYSLLVELFRSGV